MFEPQLQLFPYQETGAQFVASREACGLHDEMGVGKTATIIRAMEYANAKRGIIVVPAMLRENWLVEYRKFTRVGLRLCKGIDRHDYIAWKRGRYDVLVTSYEQATQWTKDIRDDMAVQDFIALDEAHYLKNSKTQRSKAILGAKSTGVGGLLELAERRWHITGTPMANDPLDAFTFLAMCNSLQGLSETEFIKTFFFVHKGQFGNRHVVRPEMLTTLQQLFGNNAIRRTQEQAGIQLPPIFLTSAVVDGDDSEIVALLKQYPGLDRAIERALEQGGLSFLDAQHVATLRRLIGEAKAIPYAEMLHEELESGKDKQVVYGIHRHALQLVQDYLVARGIECTLVNGDTSEKSRIAYVKSFQERKEHRVFLANIRAAGVGLTLHASPFIDLLESDWSPAGNAQAIKRVHRIGQTQTCRGRFITLARSFDEVVNRIVAAKTASIAKIEGGPMLAAPHDELAEFL